MSRAEIDALLAEIRAAREDTLAALVDMVEAEFALPTDMTRWDELAAMRRWDLTADTPCDAPK